MINAISANSSAPQKQNVSFNGQLNLVVQKTLYRGNEYFPQITSRNLRKNHRGVLGKPDTFVRSVYHMTKQFAKLIPDDVKLFYNVTHSKGKSALDSFGYKLGKEAKVRSFSDKYKLAEAFNSEVKKRGIYANDKLNPQIEKFTNALDTHANFFNIRASIDKTRITNTVAQRVVNDTKGMKSATSKKDPAQELRAMFQGLGFNEEQIEERISQMLSMTT